ncbi:CoA ester lyase [Gemmatimonas sp.]|uniref:HpcH/HpaI aldolase/citrate lyase family protein n=1 Tax=Gemmatimonas sp. TaxID=1962908 RepID=UPI0035653337
MMQDRHSWIFVPGQIPRMVDKAFGLPVDVIMLDLEDSVVPALKASARSQVAEALGRARRYESPTRFVRINAVSTSECMLDLQAVVTPGLEGIVVPKVDNVEQVRWLEHELSRLEARRDAGKITAMVLAIESPRALLAAAALASASPRVAGLMFGAEDFSRALGLPTVRHGPASDLLYARSHIVVAAAAAGVASIDGVWPDLKDATGLSGDCEMSRALGFTGKSLIHPSQIEPVTRAFQPSEQQIEFARKVIVEFDAAAAAGKGSIEVDGQLIDAPIYERARQTLRSVERQKR